MKRWKFSTLFLFAVLVLGSVIYSSNTGYSAPGDPECDGVICFVEGDPECSNWGDSCPDGGTCVWFFEDPFCCDPVLICDPFLCCQGPGCDPFCDYPGCDPFNSCESCGDGNVDLPYEQCDDGNLINGDGCDDHCIIEECGNGVIQSGEQCDDGGYCSGGGELCYNDNECSFGETCEPQGGDGCSSVCTEEECEFTNAYWADIDGNVINSTIEDELVYLTIEGTSCDELEVNFTILEDDIPPNPDDPININPSNANFVGNTVTVTWVAEWQNDCNGLCNPPEYYFIAALVSDSSVDIQSNPPLLEVFQPVPTQCNDRDDNDNDGATDFPADFSCSSSDDNDEFFPEAECQNNLDDDNDGFTDFPDDSGCTNNQDDSEGEDFEANITTLEDRGIYYINTDLEFNHTWDGAFGIEVTWVVKNSAGEEFTREESSFIHQFTTEGQRTITLIIDWDDGTHDEDQINILLIGSPGLMSYIDRPFHHEIVINESLIVMFDGSGSYAVNSEGGNCPDTPPTVTCIAGNCPCDTEGSPSGCPDETIPIGGGCPTDPINYDGLNFAWTFDDDPDHVVSTNVSGTKHYPLPSFDWWDKWVKLGLEYQEQELAEQSEREFMLDGDACILGGFWWVVVENGEIIEQFYTPEENDACKGPDDNAGTADDCCPGGYACSDNGGDGTYSCELVDNPNGYTACSSYPDMGECDADIFGFAECNGDAYDDPNCNLCGTNGCIVNQCFDKCFWGDPDGDGENSCYFKIDTYDQCEYCSEGYCLYKTTIIEECTNGWMIINVTSTYIGADASCLNDQICESGGERQIPCGQLLFDLSFFDYRQFIAAIVIIFLAYVFYISFIRDNKKRRKRKK